AYHDYEGVVLTDDERPRLVRDLGDKKFLMLRSHGLLTIGDTIANAFLYMYQFEAACTMQIRAQAGGGELVHIDPKIVSTGGEQMRKVTNNERRAAGWAG